MKVPFLLLLFASSCLGVTKEVVRIFQPVSYHDTDSATEYGVRGELVQAEVINRPVVLSGAFPEDLVKAVAMPFRFASNNPTYEVEEANLILLCQIELEVTRSGPDIEVTVDCSDFVIPELVELQARQILEMTIESIRRTLRVYYQIGAHEAFVCRLQLAGLNEERQVLKGLATNFQVGPEVKGE